MNKKFCKIKTVFLCMLLIGIVVYTVLNNQIPYMGIVSNGLVNILNTNKTSTLIRGNTTVHNQNTPIRNQSAKGIPKIIHQIWNDHMIPGVFHNNIRGLVGHNKPPEWTYYFWTLGDGERFIRDKYPELVKRFKAAYNLLKADILRLTLLHHYGGAYFDLDTVSVKPLDPYMESHDCSLVTDPPEHVFSLDKPIPTLIITNSAILCKPSNWFILHVINQLVEQSTSCKDAVSCTGPLFISKQYTYFNNTEKSSDLPLIDDYRYFEDFADIAAHNNLQKRCVEPFSSFKHAWARDVCRNWIDRGRAKRNISEKAYTYHTWFHTYYASNKQKLFAGKRNITELVKHVKFYQGTGTH